MNKACIIMNFHLKTAFGEPTRRKRLCFHFPLSPRIFWFLPDFIIDSLFFFFLIAGYLYSMSSFSPPPFFFFLWLISYYLVRKDLKIISILLNLLKLIWLPSCIPCTLEKNMYSVLGLFIYLFIFCSVL